VKLIETLLDAIRIAVRIWMQSLARTLLKITGGRIDPNAVTVVGLLLHVPVAYLIASNHLYWAALLLVVFGLTDALDGELARLQKLASPAGMLLDASSDRMKEIILFTGVSVWILRYGNINFIVWPVLALGSALLVSYVKAKGEAAVASTGLSHAVMNRLFSGGLMRFEVRIGVLVVGCAAHLLIWATMAVAVLSAVTAIGRLVMIMNAIQSPQTAESYISDYEDQQAAAGEKKKRK
jgi:phosphatidylglycerophosphate synthase